MIDWRSWLPVLVVVSSLIPGSAIFLLNESRTALRPLFNMTGAILKVVLVGLMLWGVAADRTYFMRLPLMQDTDFVLHADALSLLFVGLSAFLWLLTTIYAIGYLEQSTHRSRFFGFFSLCVSATTGIALAGNLITFLIFYELLTLTTYPLVVHYGNEKSLKAGRIYLIYTLAGSVLLLVAVVWLRVLVGPALFTERGILAGFDQEHRNQLIAIFILFIAGFGVKAAMVPLHSWLPRAMVAPAPVSALLHAVAVVKAGAFGIVRVIYDVYGIELCAELGVTVPLAIAASVTILYGSIRAVSQDDLKRRLAYSTISQVSYITLGAAIVGPLSTTGGIVHLVHQGLMKITLFFCAGNLAEALGVRRVSEMNGVAKRMPWTMTAFALGAFGMIGLPPMAGFVSKWYIGTGASATGQEWIVWVLVASTVLNAIYFLPIVYVAWFKKPDRQWIDLRTEDTPWEIDWKLLVPPLVTAALSLLVGLFANVPFSPLDWAWLITSREYTP